MKLKLLDINEVTLETKDKLCKENISLVVDNTNITPENIKSGVSILGVNGTLQGGGSGGSVEACTVTIRYNFSPGMSSNTLTYTTPEMGYETLAVAPEQTYTVQCAKNTIMSFKTNTTGREVGSISKVGIGSYLVTGDGSIMME